MALAILIIASILFYSTSRYFPKQLFWIMNNKFLVLCIAMVLALMSLFIWNLNFDLAAAFFVWLIALITILSAVIISLKLNVRYTWIWGVIGILSIIIDLS